MTCNPSKAQSHARECDRLADKEAVLPVCCGGPDALTAVDDTPGNVELVGPLEGITIDSGTQVRAVKAASLEGMIGMVPCWPLESTVDAVDGWLVGLPPLGVPGVADSEVGRIGGCPAPLLGLSGCVVGLGVPGAALLSSPD